MKAIDVVAASLLVIGGLNWGSIGLFEVDLVKQMFGSSLFAASIYTLVGVAALYQALQWKTIQSRWCHASC